MDGHVRLMILKDLGAAAAKCLLASGDEAFTYNHKVSRLPAIQEHFMILRAVRSGVSEERIARTLDVDVASIRQKRDLLEGVCPRPCSCCATAGSQAPRCASCARCSRCARWSWPNCTCAAGNYSVGYARCLVAATPAEFLASGERAKETRGPSPEEVARME